MKAFAMDTALGRYILDHTTQPDPLLRELAAGVSDRVTLTLGPALETLAAFDQPVDLAFLDADKAAYPAYYELLMDRLRPGGLLMVDNTLWTGYVADPSRDDEMTVLMREFNDLVAEDPRVTVVMLPIADGLTMVRKNG
ncbi:O-methyltransferase [Nonomuraea cavernae]|uniref:O-methyltransferase n=1 Tax=Nonomuraea cavernae TaxID=2045107 RepID=UPI0034038DDE